MSRSHHENDRTDSFQEWTPCILGALAGLTIMLIWSVNDLTAAIQKGCTYQPQQQASAQKSASSERPRAHMASLTTADHSIAAPNLSRRNGSVVEPLTEAHAHQADAEKNAHGVGFISATHKTNRASTEGSSTPFVNTAHFHVSPSPAEGLSVTARR